MFYHFFILNQIPLIQILFHKILLKILKENPNSNSNTIIVQPRGEQVVQIKILNAIKNCNIYKIPNLKILDGVFLCSRVVQINENNVALSTILSVTENKIKINKSEIIGEPINFSELQNFTSINLLTNQNNSNSRAEKLDKITNLLRTDHLNNEERESLIKICHEYNHIFYLEGDHLSYTNAITHKIPTATDIPINVKSYRYSEIHKNEVDKQIKKMLGQNIIEPSTSLWNSPVWIVPKKSDASGKKKNGEL